MPTQLIVVVGEVPRRNTRHVSCVEEAVSQGMSLAPERLIDCHSIHIFVEEAEGLLACRSYARLFMFSSVDYLPL